MARALGLRLARIEKALPHHCPACAGRPQPEGVLFRVNGQLLTGHGAPVDESVLEPCRACGAGSVLGHGIHVIVGVDPSCI